eukprot:TRINITY_DN11924_c0_g1_i3.p1 TRINITY_DN11924_c0_g1~~TRINITY_DN11924_c0_g1_i3.p1  ORF type:complete len:814 (+),score=277.19 TRINITY_DN11924_c0_g1_i3:2061-4502(+)
MMASAASRDDDDVVTQAMIDEEQALQKEAEEEEKTEQEKAKEEYEEMVQQQRFSRLKSLLDRSSIYTDFLYKRMQAQKEEEEKRAAKQAKKEAKQATSSKSSATSTRSTRHGKRATTSDSGAKPAAKKAAKTTRAKGKKGSKGKSSADSSYKITDYIKEDELKSAVDHHHQDDADEPMDTRPEEPSSRPEDQPELVTGGDMRPYQIAGVNWLKALFENGLNGILADEMGLGKTLQTIAFFAHLYQHKVRGPYLVVAPLSTLSNWHREFQRWAPTIPVILYHGSPDERAELRPQIMQQDRNLNSFATVITSYEIVMRDRRHLQHLAWKYIVVDEGHRLKNLNCRLIRELKTYQSANRLLLTGTPLQNNLSELWSLLNFLLPDVFDDLESFQRWFDFSDVHEQDGESALIAKEEEEQVLTKLHQILQPFVLRRLKTDVEVSIPPKKELVLYCPMSKEQQSYYTSVLDKTILEKLTGRKTDAASSPTPTDSGRSSSNATPATGRARRASTLRKSRSTGDEGVAEPMQFVDKIEREHINTKSVVTVTAQNMLMQLRKVCNHPYLVEYPLTPAGEYLMDENLVKHCGKMKVLDQLLDKLKAQGRKVLIFSQMTKMLDVLQDYCWLRDYKFSRLDGSVSYQDREQAITQFNEDSEVFLFLLSTRAGGLGLNLTAADTCIIYDSDWNPQQDLQAQDRCHRIGQTNTVMIYRLITANTVDQRILERAEAKRKLEKMVMHKGRFKGKGKEEKVVSPQELLELLMDDSHERIRPDCSDKVLSKAALTKVLDRSFGDKEDTATAAKHAKQYRILAEDKGKRGLF